MQSFMQRLGSRARIASVSVVVVGVSCASAFVSACGTSTGTNDGVVSVAPSILAPKAVLDDAAVVSLYVFDVSGDLACDATTGLATVSGARLDLSTASEQTDLTTAGCTVSGARYCGNIKLPADGATRIFQVVAYGAGNTELGDGCATAAVSGATVTLPVISMLRFLPPSVCGDKTVGATEQCEKSIAADSAVCDSSCHSVEQLLSNGLDTDGQTMTSDSKSDPSFLWPAEPDDSGHFLGLFTDHPSGHAQVALRVFSEDFAAVTDEGTSTQKGYLWLPNDPTQGFPPGETSGNQSLPAAVFVSGRYYVAFADDANLGNGDGSLDIHVRTMDVALAADQAADAPLGINGSGGMGESNPQTSPAIALGTNGQTFIAWTDSTTGSIMGRTLGTDMAHALGTQVTISNGSQNDGVSLATLPGSTGAYVASWISGGNAVYRLLAADGSTMGSVIAVTSSGHASHARVAALPDGRFAVAYAQTGGSNGADIFVQRYGADGTAVSGDATAVVNATVTTGDQTAPAIAPLTSEGGAFAVAWADGSSGAIRARFLGGSSGYLYNNVDGQSDEFSASIATGRQRDSATIAVGGAGPYVAIGWRDNGPGGTPGIYARRFPLPQ